MEAPNPTDPSQTICFAISGRKSVFLIRNGFRDDFGTFLAPFWPHFGRNIGAHAGKIAPETVPKKQQFFNTCFLSVWDPFWLHFGRGFSPGKPPQTQFESRMYPLGPRMDLFAPLMAILSPFSAPVDCFGLPFYTFLAGFGTPNSGYKSFKFKKPYSPDRRIPRTLVLAHCGSGLSSGTGAGFPSTSATRPSAALPIPPGCVLGTNAGYSLRS